VLGEILSRCPNVSFRRLGHVAQDLREWISAAGYDVTVTGGGRIDYNHSVQQTDGSAAEMGRAKVYGFSYGFGKGDHEKAATVISNWSQGNIVATVDNSPGLY
jgi:Janus/Ocnus family (Ocnus)